MNDNEYTFDAFIPSGGKRYTLIATNWLVDSIDANGKPEKIPGRMGTLKTAEGEMVSRLSRGKYEIHTRGNKVIPVESTDPNAP